MTNDDYEIALNLFKEPNIREHKADLINKYGSLNSAVIKITDALSYYEVEKLNQFLYQEITDGEIVYALEKVIDRRRQKDARDLMKESATRAWVSAFFAFLSALGSVVVSVCMILGLKGCQGV